MDRGLEFPPAPRGVDILDAKQQSSAGLASQVEIQQCRIGVAEMKIAVGARRKSENRDRH